MKFKLQAKYQPAGDQPTAIKELVSGFKKGFKKQTLLGVTGSGKTFTVANVIEQTQKPTLVIAHNKTLAAQLCNEFREFFPDNAVEYFVSYYDYYQPEAYLAHSDTYIEKESSINEEIDRLRHACTQALLSRKDVIIVASVSTIYALGNPKEYENEVLHFSLGQQIDHRGIMEKLTSMHYQRTTADLKRGEFRKTGQVLEIMPVNEETIYRMEVNASIDTIEKIEPLTRKSLSQLTDLWLFPAKHYVINEPSKKRAFDSIKKELENQLKLFKKQGKLLEYERLKQRTKYDLEMIKNIGYCNGIENYSAHFEGRENHEPPFTLLDYFHACDANFLTVIDESHVTLPQIRAMYHGDQSRKQALIEHGFRLPSARDNRPLTFDEFTARTKETIYTSATPADYELQNSKQIVEQIVRPTGLIDPEVIIRPITGKNKNASQIEDLIKEIKQQVKNKKRTLVTTLTKRMAEDLSDYLKEQKINVTYIHSDIDTLKRIQIITDLRQGVIDVIVGVNLLREGLDIPEVSLVAILDADKEGFLRNETSLIQTIGRAARNVDGRVILYADVMTKSINKAIDETNRRRTKQLAYNKKHHITPKTIDKAIKNILADFGLTITDDKKTGGQSHRRNLARENLKLELIADNRPIKEIITDKEKLMKQAAKNLEFELAAILRDEIAVLKAKK